MKRVDQDNRHRHDYVAFQDSRYFSQKEERDVLILLAFRVSWENKG